jgi:O-methyltransferase
MREFVVNNVKKTLRRYGYELTRAQPHPEVALVDREFPVDFDASTIEMIRSVDGFTMTGPEKLFALRSAVKYITANKIPGDFVECGVWMGGSMMAAARTLLEAGDTERQLYLFDTFEGMPKPTKEDVDWAGENMLERWNAEHRNRLNRDARASEKQVSSAMATVGYDMSLVHLVKGMVEDTIPLNAPEEIALLRLDTDYYASTLHELVHLYPRLVKGGVLIIDDYGHFKGAEQAVTEYFADLGDHVFLHRLDYSARLVVKI